MIESKDLIEVLKVVPAYLQAFSVIVAGGWAYRKFIYQRQQEPATDIDVDVRFVGIQAGQWIIEVTSTLENKSLVRNTYRDFYVGVRYLLPDDPIEDGAGKINYQLHCPNSINDRISKDLRRFGNAEYINPKQAFRHRYITFVPAEATFVWVHCKFTFNIKRRELITDAQKIFLVPKPESLEVKTAGDKAD